MSRSFRLNCGNRVGRWMLVAAATIVVLALALLTVVADQYPTSQRAWSAGLFVLAPRCGERSAELGDWRLLTRLLGGGKFDEHARWATIRARWRRYVSVEMVSRSERGGVPSVDAFRRLYVESSAVVYRYFVRATLGDRATAEDLTQETFAAVMLAARAGGAEALTLPWVMGVARHKLVDHYRRVEREQRRLARSWSSAAQVVTGPTSDGGEIVDVLRRLSPEHRLALVLKYYEELTAEQIATTIGRSLDATNSLLSRARTAFARTLEEQRT